MQPLFVFWERKLKILISFICIALASLNKKEKKAKFVMTSPHLVDIVRFGVSYLSQFYFPLKHVAMGKMPLHIKGRSFLINTFPCTSLGDVGFHGMQDFLFGSLQSTPLRAHASLRVVSSLVRFHTPHGFVFPQSTRQWGNMPLYIKGRSFLINTFPCASLGDVGLHGMQNPLFG